MEELIECPACKSTHHTFLRKCKDFTVSFEEFNIVQCDVCELQFTNPRPDSLQIGHYYESPDYISHSNSNKGIINKLYKFVRTHSIRNKLKLINEINAANEKSILDIGCGTGEFLGACQTSGWKTLGIEPNEAARMRAKTNWGINIQPEAYLAQIEPENKPSLITMWHVLEHVHNLDDRLSEIYNLIRQGGHFIVAVPNPDSWDAGHYKNDWAAYDLPRHLYHFRPKVLKNLITSYGFTYIESKPMPFDSYYVSMLSEKNKHGRNRFIQAMLNGLKSNLTAGSNSEKYSSVIYIFRKN